MDRANLDKHRQQMKDMLAGKIESVDVKTGLRARAGPARAGGRHAHARPRERRAVALPARDFVVSAGDRRRRHAAVVRAAPRRARSRASSRSTRTRTSAPTTPTASGAAASSSSARSSGSTRGRSSSRCTSRTATRPRTTWSSTRRPHRTGGCSRSAGSIRTARTRWPRQSERSIAARAASSCTRAPSASRWTTPGSSRCSRSPMSGGCRCSSTLVAASLHWGATPCRSPAATRASA